MGGFKRKTPLLALRFEGDEYDGLEIMAKSVPLGEFINLQKMQVEAQNPDASEKIIKYMIKYLVSWNLQDDEDQAVPLAYAQCRESGKPGNPDKPCSHHQNSEGAKPCKYIGLIALDYPFVLTIFAAWMEAVGNIPNLSSKISNSGETSLEQSIAMDI